MMFGSEQFTTRLHKLEHKSLLIPFQVHFGSRRVTRREASSNPLTEWDSCFGK